jgi:SH3-like domain-containing protein
METGGPLLLFRLALLALTSFRLLAVQPVKAQDPGGTATPSGPYILCCQNNDHVNVRTGPGTSYDQVGVLVLGQSEPAAGKSVGGDWVQIRYPGIPGGLGWVYAPVVEVFTLGVELPIVEPPATPTPVVTATIDPTLAAQFSSILPTRLPTYTAGVPPTQVTFAPNSAQGSRRSFPPALAILGLAFVGLVGAMVSGVVGRR